MEGSGQKMRQRKEGEGHQTQVGLEKTLTRACEGLLTSLWHQGPSWGYQHLRAFPPRGSGFEVSQLRGNFSRTLLPAGTWGNFNFLKLKCDGQFLHL